MYRRFIPMCRVNVTEFRNNISHYLELLSQEDVHVTRNGETIAIISSPNKKYYETLTRLCGCLKEFDTGEDYDDMIGEEIMRRCGY